MASVTKVISSNSKSNMNRALARSRALNADRGMEGDFEKVNYISDLLYQGRHDRLERYRIYDAMDQDLDIARALDVIAEHCTKRDDKGRPFHLRYNDTEITSSDTEILGELLHQWANTNDWDNRMWRTIRNVVKYGDAFFIRDPEDYLLYSVSASRVVGTLVDDKKTIKAYIFRDLDFSIPEVMQTEGIDIAASPSAFTGTPNWNRSTNNMNDNTRIRTALVEAKHVVHLSLSEGLVAGGNGQTDDIWPFGQSFLEQVYKDYKQRDMLESAALIHRIQRAPSRRAWYVDVGRTRPDKSGAFMRNFRNSMIAKVFPNKLGGTDMVDSTYNPLSMMEDYFLPVTSDGRGTKVENLEGSQWSSMEDLQYWTDKILRGLRVPSSYMQGPESGGAQYQNGQLGVAYMAEQQFSEFCRRIQNLVDNPIDQEFKLYMKWRGVNVHASDFDIEFTPPMDFDEYRQADLNNSRINQITSLNGIPFIAKRMILSKFGRWTQDEILENEIYWREENLSTSGTKLAQDNQMGGMDMGGNLFTPVGGGAGFGDQYLDLDGEEVPGEAGSDMGMGGDIDMGVNPVATGDIGTMPGTESKIYLPRGSSSKVLIEDTDLSVPLIKQDNSPEEGYVDGNFDRLGLEEGQPVLSLAHLRVMRIEREKNRINLVRRMRLVGQMYGGGGDSSPF